MSQDSVQSPEKEPVEDQISGGPSQLVKESSEGADNKGGGKEQLVPEGDTNVEKLAANASEGLPAGQASSVTALITSTEELANIDMDEPQEVLSKFGNVLNSYYTVALAQSARSFTWALVAAGVGVVFFMGAIIFLLVRESVEAATVSAIGGAIVEVVAGLNFYLYGKTTEQAANHRFSLERMQRYLLANSLVESLSSSESKDESRAKLISAMSESDRATSQSQDNRDAKRQVKDNKDTPTLPSLRNQNDRQPNQ
jgi:hypothetical protein